nr:MAG TPA: hypothetical protein [Caudoviricetes sp.]
MKLAGRLVTTVDFPRIAFCWRTLATAPAVTASVSHTTAAALQAALADDETTETA